jgi:CheY-like chemotaxis protein
MNTTGTDRSNTPTPLAGLRLLIVEDEALVAMDYVKMLEGAGAIIAGVASNVMDALRDIEALDFDAALLDGNLFGQSVDAVAVALARHGIPFVFVTGYSKEALPKIFAQATVVAKPCAADSLIGAVQGMRLRPAGRPGLRNSR